MPVGTPNATHTPPHAASLRALDWLNFFLAALLMGFGPFVGLYLAERGWVPANVGLILTVSGLVGLLTQIPAGELIDMVKAKRALVGVGVAAVTLGILLLGLRPEFSSVLAAAILQGMAGSVIGPGIAAISLGLVGHNAFGGRLGRNQRFASIGGLTAAALMGLIGYLLSIRDIFLLIAALALPALLVLTSIRASDIHFARSCGAADLHPRYPQRSGRDVLLKDRRLRTFAVCLFLFQFANASMLPLAGQSLARTEGSWSSLVLAGLIVVPQLIVALLAPWVGQTADTWGRRPLLLIGLGVLPVRAAAFALISDPLPLVVVQALDGLSGATLGVLTALVVADLTKGTGRFNLAQGLVGTVSGVGAALSTSITGLVVAGYGQMAGFLGVAAVGLLAVAILWLFMPETKSPALEGKPGSV
ncbi:MAG TPA: MFS transporter [Hyphomicrobiaceae bacterium]|nr:MFS transporter [Hyphomicrobiaceae bacterium]